MGAVKFFVCDSTKFTALATKDTDALYFVSDTKRLYKGDVLYGGSFEYGLPAAGVEGTLYFDATTNSLQIWDGSKFVQKFLSFETTLGNTDTVVPTSKAVKTYVDTVSGALDAALSGAIETLDVSAIGGNGKIITTISETDGKIAATATDLTTSVVARTATTNVGGTTAEDALEDLGSKIATINGSDSTDGSIAKAVKTAKDALSGAIGDDFDSTNTVKKYVDDADSGLDSKIDGVADTVAIISGSAETAGSFKAGDAALSAAIGGEYNSENTVADAIAALETAAVDISGAANNAIEVTGTTDKTVGLNIDTTDDVLTQSSNGLKANIALVKQATAEVGYAATYALSGITGILGTKINIPQDQFLSGVTFVDGSGSADDVLRFTFLVANASGTEPSSQVVDVPLSGLFNEYTQGNGITLTPTATGIEIAGKVDSASETFLTVDEGGFKLTGVQTAIDTAVNTSGAFLSGAIGSGFSSSSTVKSYIDTAESTLSANIGSGFGVGTANGTVGAYIDSKVASEASRADGLLSGKLDDVATGKAGEIITAKADGKVETSGKSVGGSTLAATPDANTVATEVAVKTYVDNAVTAGLTWQTLS